MTAIPSRKKKKREGNGCARGWCARRGSLLQDRLPVKFKDPKFKHELIMRGDMEHSYLNYFIICLQSNSVCCLPKITACHISI